MLDILHGMCRRYIGVKDHRLRSYCPCNYRILLQLRRPSTWQTSPPLAGSFGRPVDRELSHECQTFTTDTPAVVHPFSPPCTPRSGLSNPDSRRKPRINLSWTLDQRYAAGAILKVRPLRSGAAGMLLFPISRVVWFRCKCSYYTTWQR